MMTDTATSKTGRSSAVLLYDGSPILHPANPAGQLARIAAPIVSHIASQTLGASRDPPTAINDNCGSRIKDADTPPIGLMTIARDTGPESRHLPHCTAQPGASGAMKSRRSSDAVILPAPRQ
jgi:hypothetical protein